jgi:hypothetical protein
MKLSEVRDQLTSDIVATRVYGEPYQTADGATVITVSTIRGGSGKRPPGDAPGRGALGFTGAPVGVFVIRGGEVSWTPAVDANRIALLAVITGLASAVIATLAVLRRPPWPDISLQPSP